jgi:hypothetical protein
MIAQCGEATKRRPGPHIFVVWMCASEVHICTMMSIVVSR